MKALMWNLLLLLAIGVHPNRLLADGTLELNKLITGRPTLAPVLQNHPSLRSWLVDAFDGKFSKVKISWRDDDTKMRTPFGEHSYDENGAFIIISRKLSAFDQLTGVIYECMSIQHQDSWNKLWSSPALGIVDQDAFVLAARRLEHQVSLETKKLLQRYLELSSVEIQQAPIYATIINMIEDFQLSLKQNWEGATYYRSVYSSLVSVGVMKPSD